MQRTTVASTNVASIGYDSQTQTLEIEFNNGNVYQYFDVPQALYDALMGADSKGSFLNAQIKGCYRYTRL